jgi:hypothetical protein
MVDWIAGTCIMLWRFLEGGGHRFTRTSRCHIPEGDVLHSHRCENLHINQMLVIWYEEFVCDISKLFSLPLMTSYKALNEAVLISHEPFHQFY